MHETTKAMTRRMTDAPAYWQRIFKGYGLGIDVGAGDDPLRVPNTIHFDLPDGGGDDLRDFFDGTEQVQLFQYGKKIGALNSLAFDFIHGSQVLEHAENAKIMLGSWIEMLRPGGYIVATVPDFDLYEKGSWPSPFNGGHRSTWSISRDKSIAPQHIKLPEWFIQFRNVSIDRLALVATRFDHAAPANLDQTLDPEKGVECFIEFVLRKR